MEKKLDKFSKKVTAWTGSSWSIVVHTLFFIGIFGLRFFNISTADILLILTTIVSLEAIYMAIFIQMTVNEHSENLEEVSEDIEELQENVEDISEDVEEIQKDVDEIQEDVDEIQEDVEELNEDNELVDDTQLSRFEYMEHTLQAMLKEIQALRHKDEQLHQHNQNHHKTENHE